MTASHNASGAGVGETLALAIASASTDSPEGRAWKARLEQARATIESAMALSGKWRAEADEQRRIAQSPALSEDELAWHAALAQKGHADANELEAIFGPAPLATDAPEPWALNVPDLLLLAEWLEAWNRPSRSFEWFIHNADMLRGIAKSLATPPAASQPAEERIKALETVIRPHIEDLEATAKVAEDYNLLPLAEEFRKAAAEFKAALETK